MSDPASASPENSGTAMVAVLLLARPVLPAAAAVAARLRDLWPDAPALVEKDRNADSMVLQFGDAFAAAALVDTPVPWSELDGPCHTAWYWPHAETQLRGHGGHIVLTLSRDGAPVEQGVAVARALTQVAAAMADVSQAVGILWAGGTLVHDPPAFTQLATQMAPDWLPLYLWIDFRLNDEADSAYSLFTTGMNAFGFMEIEIPMLVAEDPKLLMDQAYNIAHYLLDHGPVLNDGDTVGMSPTIKMTVHHAPSFLGATQLVYSLRP